MQFDQVDQGQIAAELFTAADSLVVGEKISSAIQDEATLENFDRFHVMGRMAMHDGDTFLDQTMGKRDLLARNFVAPIADTVNRREKKVAMPFNLPHFSCDPGRARF